MLTGQLALTTAAVFTGAAIYVSVCEQPARLRLDDRALLIEWKPSYKHGAAMKGPRGRVGTPPGAAAWWAAGDWLWLLGAVVFLSAWPYTLLIIRPTNNELLTTDPGSAGARSRALIQKWGWLHAGRSGIGLLTTVLFLWASIRASP